MVYGKTGGRGIHIKRTLFNIEREAPEKVVIKRNIKKRVKRNE